MITRIKMLMLAGLFCSPVFAGQTQNVVLIVADGLRWQEMFGGADLKLLDEAAKSGWTSGAGLEKKYGGAEPDERRRRLFPFIWDTIARQGEIFGNERQGSVVRVTNHQWFSYPGYSEMASGVADPAIDSNDFGPNPNVTVFEWLNTLPKFRGQVDIFGTWGAFHRIFNGERSKLPIRAGATLVDEKDPSPRGRLLRELYVSSAKLEDDNATDAMLHVALREHLRAHRPRVLFVGYGDTDLWQHMGRYDAFLETAHAFDGFVADLWRQLQSLADYRGKTTFIITTDHGRGSVDWKEHGIQQAGSDQIWMAMMGPDTPALGERQHVPEISQSQIAATLAAFLGEDFSSFKKDAARPLPDLMHRSTPAP